MTENNDNLSTLVEIDEESVVSIQPNRFRMLCDNVENCFFEIHNSMYEMLELKDKLLLQYLPRNVFQQITLVFSRCYRAYSQVQIPVYELIRLVHLYSEPFDMKCNILKKFYDSNETKKRMLNLALQKLTSMENHTQQYQEQKIINQWEKMYVRLALPRANVRKWKFRIRTFREKAELGYEHVIQWIHKRNRRSSLELDNLTDDDDDQLETPSSIVNVQEKAHISDDSKEVTMIEMLRAKSAKLEEPIVIKVDVDIQVQPDFDDQQTSTDDILSTKFIIMRIYRPIEISKTKFQCIVHAHEHKYTTKMFLINQKPIIPNRTKKSKKHSEVPTNTDIDIIDKQQYDEFRIPMPNVLKRHSLFQIDIDPDAIKIDVYADELLYGSLILSSEDLRMLDLPNLSNPIHSPLISHDDDDIPSDFDQSSNELYNSWISHTPHLFSIYNTKHEVIGKLPILMFWYKKFENIQATKSTMTMPIETRVPTPKIIPNPIIEVIIPNTTMDETNSFDNDIEVVKASYENEIAQLHENYQTEIARLTNILNQIFTEQSIDISQFEENIPERIQITKPKQQIKPDDVPKSFLDRYEMYLQRSIIHRHQLISKIEHETALANERQMEFQHRLYKPDENQQINDDLCLPAVFMPFKSGNVINPRAYQYFHPTGSASRRLTQAPSILKFPSLPSRSVSVLNLFELSQTHEKTRPTTQGSD